jgi:hypothetical protein
VGFAFMAVLSFARNMVRPGPADYVRVGEYRLFLGPGATCDKACPGKDRLHFGKCGAA